MMNWNARSTLAELSGWLNLHPSGLLNGQIVGTNPKNPIIGKFEEIPDYFEDLNAAHDALMSQPIVVRKAVRFHLWERLGQMNAHEMTARDVSECLLLVKR